MANVSTPLVRAAPLVDAIPSRDHDGHDRDRDEHARLELRPPTDDAARWRAWNAHHAASDRRTAGIMRLLAALMLLAAAGWVILALLARP